MQERVLFIDRDGTLIEEPDDFQVDALEKIALVPGVVPALLELQASGFRLVMVTNQDGLGTDSFPLEHFEEPHAFLLQLFASQGVTFDEVFICPHLPDAACDCRKPRTGLLTAYLAKTNLDCAYSAVIGDRETDLQMAERIGVRGIRVNSGNDSDLTWPEIVVALCHAERTAELTRKTNETNINIGVNLDHPGNIRVSTGIGFFDHMLEQIAKHGGFSMSLECEGDLHVDEHHTVEDVALSLGAVLRQALGHKQGVGRYGFVLPMDESRCQVALDLSGRPAFRFEGNLGRESVGELHTEMVEHFFRSLAESLGAALHIDVSGDNTHHMVEACFKAVGRSLRQALARSGNELPSTKGVLT